MSEVGSASGSSGAASAGTTPAPAGAASGATTSDSSSAKPAGESTSAISPSQAGKTLSQVRADRKAAIKDAKPEAKPDAAAKPDPKKDAAKTDGDEDLGALIKLDRETKSAAKKVADERAAFEAERKTHEPIIAAGKAALEAKGKGDPISALRALGYTQAEIESDVFMTLVTALKTPEDFDPAKLPEVIDTRVKAELAAAKQAEKDTAEKAAKDKAENDAKAFSAIETKYLADINKEFNANAGKYPEIARMFQRLGKRAGSVVADELLDRARDLVRTGKPNDEASLLAHYEAELAALNPPTAGARPAATPTSAWRSDPGRPDAPKVEETIDQIRERRRAALRQGNGARS